MKMLALHIAYTVLQTTLIPHSILLKGSQRGIWLDMSHGKNVVGIILVQKY